MMRRNCLDDVVTANAHQQPHCRCALSNCNSISGHFFYCTFARGLPLSQTPKPRWVYVSCRCPPREHRARLLIQTHVYLKHWLTRWVLIYAEKQSVRAEFWNPEMRPGPAVGSYSAKQITRSLVEGVQCHSFT